MFYDREMACSGKYKQVYSYDLIFKSIRILKIDSIEIDLVCVLNDSNCEYE